MYMTHGSLPMYACSSQMAIGLSTTHLCACLLLYSDPQGFIAIDECMAVAGGPPGIFACGDVASCAKHPRPKAGVYAVRQVGACCQHANVSNIGQGKDVMRSHHDHASFYAAAHVHAWMYIRCANVCNGCLCKHAYVCKQAAESACQVAHIAVLGELYDCFACA